MYNIRRRLAYYRGIVLKARLLNKPRRYGAFMDNSKINPKDTKLALAVTAILIVSCIFLNISLVFGFLGSILTVLFILLNKGMPINKLKEIIYEGIVECKTLYILILLIGATVSMWLSSGVVPAMIYYGLKYMGGINFLLSAFLITSIMAIFMGTAVGTISTIGLALLGIGKGFGIPSHILLGAIVSGAFIADKISPISGLLNLTLTATKIKYREALRAMIVTLIPTYILTAFIYYYIGQDYVVGGDVSSLMEYQSAISQSFNISPWLMILPVGILLLSIAGLKTISTILLGLVGGVIASTLLQGMSIIMVFKSMFFGYSGNTVSDKLNSVLISGGIISMLEVVCIVGGAVALSGLLEKSGLIKPLISKAISSIKTEKQLLLRTGMISGILTIITCDQTVGIVLPGRVLNEKYRDMDVESSILARSISDTGTIIAPLFPWNVNSLIIGMISGVSAISYGPYAVLCYICPIIFIFSSLGFRVKRDIKAKALC